MRKQKQNEQGSKELNSKDAYCYGKEGEVYAIYLPDASEYKLNLSTILDSIGVEWFDLGICRASGVADDNGSGGDRFGSAGPGRVGSRAGHPLRRGLGEEARKARHRSSWRQGMTKWRSKTTACAARPSSKAGAVPGAHLEHLLLVRRRQGRGSKACVPAG